MNVGLFPSFFIYKYSKICRNLQIISVLNNVKMKFLQVYLFSSRGVQAVRSSAWRGDGFL